MVADPEKYVDTGFNICYLDQEDMSSDLNIEIWNRINAEASLDYYYVCQDWWWLDDIKKDEKLKDHKQIDRRYSYLGLYRKFCEADIHELIRLKK